MFCDRRSVVKVENAVVALVRRVSQTTQNGLYRPVVRDNVDRARRPVGSIIEDIAKFLFDPNVDIYVGLGSTESIIFVWQVVLELHRQLLEFSKFRQCLEGGY
ncbi:hypothetical protein HYQ46_003373 [Verticillium longisporum]|nr:hypothetical protein HYQ46_003373 [Verticillium longisporum]